MVTGSRELIREMNRKLVLETVINEGPLSRASISKKLGLTKATISAIIQELIDNGYVEEIGSDDTSYGRKPILLSFCRQNGYVFSLDVGVQSTSVLVCDLMGRNCCLRQYPQHLQKDNVLPFLTALISEQLNKLPPTRFGLIGISLGIHGTVCRNLITFAPNYPLAQVPLALELEKTFRIPVLLENEANLSALAEKTFVQNYKNLIQISVHSGVGAGIILEHNLYTGACGTAGEFGHTIVEPDGLPCPCGNQGCLEQYISDPAILSYYAGLKNTDVLPDMNTFIAAYRQDEEAAVQSIHRFVRYLACGVNNLWNLFSPECIIVNSLLTAGIPEIIPMIFHRLSPRFSSTCTLKASVLQDIAILLGGVRNCVCKFLEIEKLSLLHFRSEFSEIP